MKPKQKKYAEDIEFLRDLAKRLWRIPVMYGTDQFDIDRLRGLAKRLEEEK